MATYSKAFWTAKAAEMLERMAYYAVFIVITLYLSNTLGFPREFFKYADNIKMTIDSTHIRPECTIPKVEQIAAEGLEVVQAAIEESEGKDAQVAAIEE